MKYIGLDCHKQYDHATMIGTDTGEIKAKEAIPYQRGIQRIHRG